MRPVKGLHTDFRPISQPADTTRFVLNGIEDGFDGNLGSLSTEPGNELCFTLDGDTVGTVTMTDDEVVIFSVTDTYSEIGLAKGCNYTPLVKSDCLNFSKEYPVKGLSRIKDCERIVYFYDTNNPDRYLNLDSLEAFLKPGETIPSTSTDKWDCERFNLNFSFQTVSITDINITQLGSQLVEGSYAFAFSYVDAFSNQTDYFSFTDPIHVQDNNTIRFTISNIDTSYSFIKPAVIAFTADDGATTTVYELPNIGITATSIEYTFTSVNSGIVTDLGDINIPGSNFVTSKSMEIVNNRLVRANLREKDIDWVEFQREALNIIPRWITKGEEVSKSTNQKIIRQKSLRRDEVYALGIIYTFTDGTESPVFHIPGRDPDLNQYIATGNLTPHWRTDTAGPWDTATQTVVTGTPTTDEVNNYSVEHIPLVTGDTAPRWQIYNTAIKDTLLNDNKGYWSEGGLMGYYESNELYPETVDCNGQAAFGALAGEPIRYHRMPDLTIAPVHFVFDLPYIAPLLDTELVFHLGIELQNVNIPPNYVDQITGYRVVYSRIDNPTVVDSGMLELTTLSNHTLGNNPQETYLAQSLPYHRHDIDTSEISTGITPYTRGQGFSGTYYSFISPTARMNGGASTFNYVVGHGLYRGIIDERYNGAAPAAPDFGERRYNTTLKRQSFLTENTTRAKIEQLEIPINTILQLGTTSFVNAGQQETTAIEVSFPFEFNNALLNGNPQNPTEFQTITDEEFIYYPEVSLKRTATPHEAYDLITYVQFDAQLLNDTNPLIFGGDTYITDFTLRKTSRAVEEEESGLDIDVPWYDVTSVIRFYTESSINANLREEADGAIFIASDATQQDGDVFYPFSLTVDDFLEREPEYRNYFFTNSDFSVKNFYKEHRTLTQAYEYCGGCNEYPNLLAYSEISSDIDQFDNFRKFRVNNLATIPGSRGEITNLVYFRKNLMVFTRESLFQLVPNPQQVISDVGAIYLGTAEFLSIPSNELIQGEHGHAGTSGRFNIKKTPYGIFYVDIEQGKVYKFYDGLEDISALGMHNFFQERRGYELDKQFNDTFNIDYPLTDNTIVDEGVGTIAVYDPRYERYILTKTDRQTLVAPDQLQACYGYPLSEDAAAVSGADWRLLSANPFLFPGDGVFVIPPGVYDNASIPGPTFDPNTFFPTSFSRPTYGRIYYHLQSFFAFAENPTTAIDWTSPNTFIQFQDALLATGFQQYQGQASTSFNSSSGVLGVEVGNNLPYMKLPEIFGVDVTSVPALGMFYDSTLIGARTLFQPQVRPDFLGFIINFENNIGLVGSQDVGSFQRITSPKVDEAWITNPDSNKVVELTVQTSFNIQQFPVVQTFSLVYPNSRRHVLGVKTPNADNWDVILGFGFTIFTSTATPTAYLSINDGGQTIPLTLNSNERIPGILQVQVQETFNLDLNKDDTLDIIIVNNDDGEDFVVGGAAIFMTSTTDTNRENCFYTDAGSIFDLGDYSPFNISGYPTGAVASTKTGNLTEPAYQVAEAYTAPSTTYLAASSPHILTGGGISSNGAGVYEILEEQSPLEFVDVANGDVYTINVYNAETNDLIGTFEYDLAISTANGYDTFYYQPTGTQSYVTKTDNSPLFRVELTTPSDITTAIEHDEGYKWYKIVNATSSITNSTCPDFIIREYDSLTGTTPSAFSLDVGTVPRLINYVEVDTPGQYDIHFRNNIDITNPAFSWEITINDIVYSGVQVSNADPNELAVTLKDVQLLAGDVIKLSVTNVDDSSDSDDGQWLTILVKKDYYCVETLPKSNESHTISYDVKNNHWSSFHSYLPKWYYNDSQSYYSTEDLKNWYKHLDNNFNTYYNTKYPHIVEFVVNDVNTTILNSLQWIGKVESYDETNKQWVEVDDTTYNKFMVYNSKQSTGIQELDFEQSPIEWSNVTKRVLKSDYNYRTAGIRNIATALPVNTSDWDEIETTFEDYGYIDKIPLTSSVDYNITMADLSPLRDKYHVVRLIYDGDQLYRISLDVTGTQQQYSRQ